MTLHLWRSARAPCKHGRRRFGASHPRQKAGNSPSYWTGGVVPGGGANADETGGGQGLGSTLNLPVDFGMPRRDYLTLYAVSLEKFAAKIKPQLVLVSAGFDTHRKDPVGSLGLETEDFIPITNAILDVA